MAMAMDTSQDVLSELLIAQLLEEDMKLMEYSKEAEKIQLDQVLAASAAVKGKIPKYATKLVEISEPSDGDIAFGLYASDARVSSDASYAQSLQLSYDSTIIANRQSALKIAATDKKMMLDAEIAKRLQTLDKDGQDIDSISNLESLVDPDAMDRIMQTDPNDKGKGKGRRDSIGPDEYSSKKRRTENPNIVKKEEEAVVDFNYSSCGICFDPCQVTFSPYAASQSANSSNRLQFAIRLPCPSAHTYCMSCLISYIQNKLDPEGTGGGKTDGVVFPIRCPGCPPTEFLDGIQNDIAERVLGEKGMVPWHHQKLLDSLVPNRLYCPNKKCSAQVLRDEDTDQPNALCPSCDQWMCVPCRVSWHKGLTCEQYQALPPDERSPEDQLLLELANAKKWRRCPSCAGIVELISGCNHITCRCGTHFCHKCGALADPKTGKCLRQPAGCALWDEELLLEANERGRDLNRPPPPVIGHYNPPPAYNYVPPPPRNYVGDLFEWMDDPDIVSVRHWFTGDMIRTLTCGYCDSRLNSLADLQYHLSHVTRHPVFTCCGRFFKRDIDFQRHQDSYPARFGRHVHTFGNG